MEDPVRICRALRFAAKLRGFTLHSSFWLAVPFALQARRLSPPLADMIVPPILLLPAHLAMGRLRL
eukprot:2158260-Heterocapsa_arctica.AAC.1